MYRYSDVNTICICVGVSTQTYSHWHIICHSEVARFCPEIRPIAQPKEPSKFHKSLKSIHLKNCFLRSHICPGSWEPLQLKQLERCNAIDTITYIFGNIWSEQRDKYKDSNSVWRYQNLSRSDSLNPMCKHLYSRARNQIIWSRCTMKLLFYNKTPTFLFLEGAVHSGWHGKLCVCILQVIFPSKLKQNTLVDKTFTKLIQQIFANWSIQSSCCKCI